MIAAVENLYVVQNGNGSVDTIRSSDPRMVDWILSGCGYDDRPRGGIMEVNRVSVLADLELDSTMLKLDYGMSQN